MTELVELTLEQLSQRVRLSPARCNAFVEACKVCLEEQQHASGVALRIEGIAKQSYVLRWQGPIGTEIFESWDDPEEATEDGACAIAWLVLLEMSPFTVVRRARKKTGVDYWLAHKDDELIQHASRLEISGIRKGTSSIISSRVAQKRKQTKQSDKTSGGLPAYIVIVEFSRPLSHVEVRNV